MLITNELRSKILHREGYDLLDVYLYRYEDQYRTSIALPMGEIRFEMVSNGSVMKPMLFGPSHYMQETIQAIVDAAWEYGIKPKKSLPPPATVTVRELQTVKDHLYDVRAWFERTLDALLEVVPTRKEINDCTSTQTP